MRSSAVGRPRVRSVKFETIDEEPELAYSLSRGRRKSNGSLESKESEWNSSLDDLDRSGNSLLDRSGNSLFDRSGNSLNVEYPPTVQNRQSTASSAPRHNSRQSSGVVSALRRLTLSWFGPDPSADQGGGGPQQQPNPPNPYAPYTLPPGGNNAENRRDRRSALIARQRLAIGTRNSSMASSGVGGSRPGGDGGHGDNDEVEVYCLSDAKIRALRLVIDNRYWRGITLFFILVLLFGPPIQDIWLPKSADGFMDGILSFGFVVLAFDILTRSVVDNSYFSWHRKGSQWWDGPFRQRGWCNLHAGSFTFWLDTVALLTILYRLSYINPVMRSTHTVTVRLNKLGFPVAGLHATPLSFEWPLMLMVGRVGLMTRFIRTSVIVRISSSWRWPAYFYPGHWTSKCKRGEKGEEPPSVSQKTPDPFSVSSSGDSGLPKTASETEGTPEYPDELSPQAEERPSPTKAKDFSKGLAKKRSSGADSLDESPPKARRGSGFGNDAKDSRSHVGAAMRELTGQRIATGALVAVLMAVVCDWHEDDTTKVMTMLTLHAQTANANFANRSVNVARSSVIPTLYSYTRVNETNGDAIFNETYALSDGDWTDLRDRERLSVNVFQEGSDESTHGLFDNSQLTVDNGKVQLVFTILLLFVWVLGVASFAGPVMTLVVQPIERMVRLLSLLMKDPLGYQSTPQYHKLKHEDDDIADKYKSIWPKEVLKGMETNFLMSTILRIGSLMRVGFGSAGVEIIRNNLERGRHKDVLFLSKQGGSVSCIFLFCDIRSFTDATECLQEEVFVFTNKVAAVVHSICHAYGGSANKNIGDAFLVSWLLDEPPAEKEEDGDPFSQSSTGNLNLGKSGLYAKNNQADKALLSVVKILMALHYDDYYVDDMNEAARIRLLAKLSKRKGPVVQMGFGLHAGKAVQGAIGSQRKLDATYISESVERSEFLESSTKKYGVPLLMSDAFYNLLDSATRNRCRKVDQLIMLTEEEDGDPCDPHELLDSGEKMDIYTFDMDIDALWRDDTADDDNSTTSSDKFQENISQRQRSTNGATSSSGTSLKRRSHGRRSSFASMGKENPFTVTNRYVGHRRASLFSSGKDVTKSTKSDLEKAIQAATEESVHNQPIMSKTLVLPTGVRTYNERAWREPDIKKIRHDYVSNGIIFPKYQEGLKSYCTRDWDHAKQCFEFVLSQREDGPSRCFLDRMEKYGGVPPRNFIGYTRSDEL